MAVVSTALLSLLVAGVSADFTLPSSASCRQVKSAYRQASCCNQTAAQTFSLGTLCAPDVSPPLNEYTTYHFTDSGKQWRDTTLKEKVQQIPVAMNWGAGNWEKFVLSVPGSGTDVAYLLYRVQMSAQWSGMPADTIPTIDSLLQMGDMIMPMLVTPTDTTAPYPIHNSQGAQVDRFAIFQSGGLAYGWSVTPEGYLAVNRYSGPGKFTETIITKNKYQDFTMEWEVKYVDLYTAGGSIVWYNIATPGTFNDLFVMHSFCSNNGGDALASCVDANETNPQQYAYKATMTVGSNYMGMTPSSRATPYNGPVHAWNKFKLEKAGSSAKHFINGVKVLERNDLQVHPGYIQFQYSNGSYYRNVVIDGTAY